MENFGLGILTLNAIMYAGSGEGSSPMRFDGCQVYRVTPQTTEQLELLFELEENCTDYNFWTCVSVIGRAVDIMVPPHKKSEFQDLLNLQNLNAELWIKDVQERIENEKRKVPKKPSNHDWKGYQTLGELNVWLDNLAEKYPEIITPVVGGISYEGREIKGVKVLYPPVEEPNCCRAPCAKKIRKKIVFIEGGIHAREWISPATVTYILNKLLTSEDQAVRDLAENREWHVFPCVNPDGYVYSHTTDRLWRKNRKPYGRCIGVDLNRNWSYHWKNGRASGNPDSNLHAGERPFSEIETRSLSRYISGIADFLEVYLSFHSYSQKILYPYGHNGFEKPKNHEEHHIIGKAAAESLALRHGTSFEVGNWAEALYVSGGISIDWAKGVHKNIRLAFTYELRDTGSYGFLLPPEQIIPTGEETFDSVVRIFQELDQLIAMNPPQSPRERHFLLI